MGEKALWPAVAAIAVICATASILLIAGTDVSAVLALFGLLASLTVSMVSLMLYGKMNKIEQNTNGTAAEQLRIIRDLLEHTKRSVPLDATTRVEMSTNTTTNEDTV